MNQGRWPIMILIGLFLLAMGFWLGRHSADTTARRPGTLGPIQPTPLTFWLFDKSHLAEYQARQTELETAASAALTLVQTDKGAHHDALSRSFETQSVLPDLCEIEILRAGPFLAPPDGSPSPLMDLTERLKAGGYLDRIPAGRWAPWTHDGHIYGIPHDIHPCVLLYRKDLYDAMGIDPKACATWADFVAACEKARAEHGGTLPVEPLFLSDTGSAQLLCLLYQAGADPFDGAGGVTLRSSEAAAVLTFYRDLFTQHHLARAMVANGLNADLQTLREGQGAAVIAPDWYLGIVESECPELSGRWAVAPLPAWRAGGRQTSTWGGTMLGISRFSEHPDAAWRFACAAYLDLTPEAATARFRTTRILVPDRRRWNDPVFQEKVAYFNDQPLGALLASLADDVPPLQSDARFGLLRDVLSTAVYDVIKNGADPHTALTTAAEKLEVKP